MFNKVILVGNLTRDIEFRYLQNGGTALGKSAIAVNRRYRAADGTQKEESMFIDVDFFGRLAETANQFLHRGSKVLIEGRLKQDTWTDQNGQNRSKHAINVDNFEMLDPNPNSQAFNQNRGGQGGYGGGYGGGAGGNGGYGGGGYGGQGGGYSRGGYGGQGGGNGGYGGGGSAGGQGYGGGYGAGANAAQGGGNAGANGGYGGGAASQGAKNAAQQPQPQQEKLPEIDVDSDKFDGDDNVPF